MGRQQILPLTTFLELDASQRSGFGVSLAPLEDLETLRGAVNDLNAIPVIALDFPSFANGTSYSKAQILQQHDRYEGEIRATGDVLPDQLPLMLRVGFNALEVTHPVAIRALEDDLPNTVPQLTQIVPGDETAEAATGYSWRRVAR